MWILFPFFATRWLRSKYSPIPCSVWSPFAYSSNAWRIIGAVFLSTITVFVRESLIYPTGVSLRLHSNLLYQKFVMMANCTLGACGEAKLNCTLGESPTHWRVRQQPRKKKHSLHFCFGGGEISFKKGKGVFLSGFCPPSIRAVRGASLRTRQSENLFFWGKGFFALPRLIFRPQEGSGEECGRDSLSDFSAVF